MSSLLAYKLGYLECQANQQENKKRRKTWTKRNIRLRRTLANIRNERNTTITDLKKYLNITLMEAEQLFNILVPSIETHSQVLRDTVTAKQKLSILIQFLVAKETIANLAVMFSLSEDEVRKIIYDTNRAIIICLRHYVQCPRTINEWKIVADQFQKQRNFPHCVGAIAFANFKMVGSTENPDHYLNENGFYTEGILAVVNANHEFVIVETGFHSYNDNDDIFYDSRFMDSMYSAINLPDADSLPNSDIEDVPYVFLADGTVTLHDYAMVPVLGNELTAEEKTFNQRWSAAQRVAEDAIWFMESRFKILNQTIDLDSNSIRAMIGACTVLHNYMIRNVTNYILDEKNSPKEIKTEFPDKNDFELDEESVEIRNKFVKYFSSENKVDLGTAS